MACAISSLIYKIRGRDCPDQSKLHVGKAIRNVTELTLTVSTVLVLQTPFLNPIFVPEKKKYLFGSIGGGRIVNGT